MLRGLVELIAVVVLGVWGFTEFAWPWPALLVGVGAPLFGVLVWALFLSPRSVLRVDAFGTALIEIVLFSAAALAILFLGWGWWWSVLLMAAGTTTGIITGRQGLQ